MTPPADDTALVPYPGLRPFQRDETAVFFGRDGAVHDLLRRLSASRFLAVLGASGSGKSSLVRTGMLEGLEMGLLAGAGSSWRVIDIAHPGADPMLALARALCAPDAPEEEVEQMRAFLLEGPRSLIAWAQAGNLAPGENLLLLIDQFEEIFRYRSYHGHQDTEAFVALILQSAQNAEVPIFVTLTMRSEYLGAAALFTGLAEAMNGGQYLTPRLGRDQCRAAIEGPAAVCGFELEPELITALLNDLARFAPWSEDGADRDMRGQLDMLGRRADQLPLLQHVLNRLWLRAAENPGPKGIVLSAVDYATLGGLSGAIDQHADSIADSLPPEGRALVPAVFRALTTGPTVAEAVRRPTPLATLAQVCGSDIATVSAVVQAFRAPGCHFLLPPPDGPLTPDTVIDISHESLIRQWTRLSGWLQDEARDAESLARLDRAAAQEASGAGELLEGRNLSPLAAWRRETRLTDAWAARYIADPARAFEFLDRSIAAATKRRRRTRLFQAAAVAGVFALAAAVAVIVVQKNSRFIIEAELARTTEQAARTAELAALAQEQEALADRLADQIKESRDALSDFARTFITRNLLAGRAGVAADVLAAAALLPPGVDNPLSAETTLSALWLRTFGRPPAEIPPGADPDLLNLAPASPFTLRDAGPTDTGDLGRVYQITDRRSGRVTGSFTIPEEVGTGLAEFALSDTGRSALLRDSDGRLLRWEAGQTAARRVLDRAWLVPSAGGPPGQERSLGTVVFDEARGDIGLAFAMHNSAHLMILPPTGAAEAPILPNHAALAAVSSSDSSTRFDLLGLQGGALIVQFNGYANGQVFALDPVNGSARAIGPVLLPGAQLARTTDPTIYNLLYDPPSGRCLTKAEAASAPAFPDPSPARAGSTFCLATLDVVAGALSPAGGPYPAASAPPITPVPLAPFSPEDPPILGGLSARFAAAPMPPVAFGPPPDDTSAWTPWLDSWRWLQWTDGAHPFISKPVEVRQLADGMQVWSFELWSSLGFDTRDADIGPDAAAAPDTATRALPEIPVDPVIRNLIPSDTPGFSFTLDGNAALVTDAAGTFAVLLSGTDELGPVPLAMTLAPDCQALGTASFTGQTRRDGAEAAAMASELAGPGSRVLQLGAAGGDWFLVHLARADRIAALRLTERAPDKTPTAELHCPAGQPMTTVIGADTASGQVALSDTSGRRVAVWSFGPGATGPITAREVDVPDRAQATTAAFLSTGQVAIGTAEGRLFLLFPGNTELIPIARVPLPGRITLQAAGTRLLISRPTRTDLPPDAADQSLTLLMVDMAPASAPWTPTHAGILPLLPASVLALRPAPDGPLVEVVTGTGFLLRIGLPDVPPPEALFTEVQTLASPDPVLTGNEGAELAIVRLLLSSFEVDLSPPPLAAMAACGAMVERALARAVGVAGAADLPSPGCTDANAVSLASAIPAAPADGTPPAITPEISALLQRAAAGDSVALRAAMMLLAGKDETATALLAVGARGFGDRVLSPGTGLPDLPLPYADPMSGDATAHMRLARQALDSGDAATAFRHAWIAEAILSSAAQGEATLSAAALAPRELRYAAGNLLTPPQRLAILADLSGWTPAFAPPPDVAPGLDADLAALDAIAAQSGAQSGAASGAAPDIALIQLARLEQDRAAAAPADRAALAIRTAEFAVAVPHWPEGAVRGSDLVAVLSDLRRDLPPEAAPLALRLDAALISAVEMDGPLLPLDDEFAMANHVSAMNRLLAAPADQRPAITSALRLAPWGLDFGLDAFGSIGAVPTLDFIALRGTLAAAYPDAPRSPATAAASDFWRAVVLDRQSSNTGGQEAEKLRQGSEPLRKSAFRALFDLYLAGQLEDTRELALLANAANWVDGLLPFDPFPYGDPWQEQLSTALYRLAAEAEMRGTFVTNLVSTGVLAALAVEHGFDVSAGLPNSATGPAAQPALRIALETIVAAQANSIAWKKGEATRGNDDNYFSANDWPISLPYAIAWTAAPGTLAAPDPAAGACATLSAFPYDPGRRVPGVLFETLMSHADAAVAACRAELAQARQRTGARTDDLMYMLGRALDAAADARGEPDVVEEAMTCFLMAAEGGNIPALNNIDRNLAITLGADRPPFSRAYRQRVLLSHFPAAFSALSTLSLTQAETAALLSLATEAADLGSGEANMILYRTLTDPVEKAVRGRIALRILQDDGPGDFSDSSLATLRAAEMLGWTGDLTLDRPTLDYIDARVDAWSPVPLPDLSTAIADAYPDPDRRKCE